MWRGGFLDIMEDAQAQPSTDWFLWAGGFVRFHRNTRRNRELKEISVCLFSRRAMMCFSSEWLCFTKWLFLKEFEFSRHWAGPEGEEWGRSTDRRSVHLFFSVKIKFRSFARTCLSSGEVTVRHPRAPQFFQKKGDDKVRAPRCEKRANIQIETAWNR